MKKQDFSTSIKTFSPIDQYINKGAGLHVVIELVGKHIYTITLCVCVYVRKTPESGSLVVLFTRQNRLLLNQYGLSMSLLGNWTLGYAHTHTHTQGLPVWR